MEAITNHFTKAFWRQKINKLSPLGLLFIILFYQACKNKDSDLGIALRADGGFLNNTTSDTFTVRAYTINEDSIKTDSLNNSILGYINDNAIGKSSAALAFECKILETGFTFGTSPKVDSAVLVLKYDNSVTPYGNINDNISLNVFKLNEKLSAEKKYYSNYNIQKGTFLTNFIGKMAIKDSVPQKIKNNTIKVSPHIRIKLPASFASEIANAPASTFASNENFQAFLKGFIVEPQANQMVQTGAIVGIDLINLFSKLVVYYNDSLSKEFVCNSECERINLYQTTATNPELITQLNNPNKHYQKTFIQALGSCKTKIDLPNIRNLYMNTNGRILIHEAAISITPESGSYNSFFPIPLRLILFQPNATTKLNNAIIDYVDLLDPSISRLSSYDGTFNAVTGEYTIRFTRHLQSVINDYYNNGIDNWRDLYLAVGSDRPITPYRLILNTNNTLAHKNLKVKIIYSQLN